MLGWLTVSVLCAAPVAHIAQVRALTREQADSGQPVLIRGVITWRSPMGDFAVQDDTGGTWVQIGVASRSGIWTGDNLPHASLDLGKYVEVDGITSGAAFAPSILPRAIRGLGEKPLPTARPVDPARFLAGVEAGQRIEARGVVLGLVPTDTGWELRVESSLYSFWVAVPRAMLATTDGLLDAVVTVRGVGATEYNSRGEFLSAGIMVGAAGDVIIEQRGESSPFDVPQLTLERLRAFHSDVQLPHRVRVEGTVVIAQPGQFLYLEDRDRAIRVETRSPLELKPGDRVQAVGFVDMTRKIAGLGDADVRKVGETNPVQPLDIAPESVLALTENAKRTGRALKRDFDGVLIRFDAKLLTVQALRVGDESRRQLVLKRDDMLVTAVVSSGHVAAIDALRPNSDVRVSAVVQLEYSGAAAPRNQLPSATLSLLVRSPADVVVLHTPSWWTPQRLAGAVAIVAIALSLALTWAWQLRRQVRRKAAELAEEMRARRNAAIEFQATLRERNRLAANLHDTLLQTMGGIGFQLDACEAEIAGETCGERPLTHLGVARDMVVRAVDELRNSVWALRTLPIAGVGLHGALTSLAQRLAAGQKTRIDVRIDGDLSIVPDFVAGNLVLATQEALYNALRHAKAQQIAVEAQVKTDPPVVEIFISDDGVGFAVGAEPKMADGHFGLTGIRERMRGLDGTVTIESTVRQGTMVRLRVPLRAYDLKMT